MRWEKSAANQESQVFEVVLGWLYLWCRVSPLPKDGKWLAQIDNSDGWARHEYCDNEQAAKEWCADYLRRCLRTFRAAVEDDVIYAEGTEDVQGQAVSSEA